MLFYSRAEIMSSVELPCSFCLRTPSSGFTQSLQGIAPHAVNPPHLTSTKYTEYS